ncbi:hypothetical protein [Streptomyces cinereoruber]|uniref:hypothetical protein n=1 Tax=Streptomyces cinereoruber TaxID=67260 RepID=UPI0036646892
MFCRSSHGGANTFLAGTLGVTTSQVARARGILSDGLTPDDFGPAPLLDVPLTARIGAAPWREAIGFDDVDVLVLHLSTAALICCAYLYGMQPEEVLALRRGCCTRVEREDGTVRFEIRGRHFKGVLDEDGNAIGEGEQRADPWIVLEPVARAIAVVEELTACPADVAGEERVKASSKEPVLRVRRALVEEHESRALQRLDVRLLLCTGRNHHRSTRPNFPTVTRVDRLGRPEPAVGDMVARQVRSPRPPFWCSYAPESGLQDHSLSRNRLGAESIP